MTFASRHRLHTSAAGMLLMAVVLSPACSAQPAARDRGHALAIQLCGQCHAVDRRATGPIMADVPSFAAIAARSHVTAEYLAARIIVPHPEMPGVALTRQELRDIIAYIMDLK